MKTKIRDPYALLLGVNDEPPNSSHGGRKAIVSGEVVNISVYSTVYKPVYRDAVKPTPNTDELPDDRIDVNAEQAGNAPYFRLVG
jgi:hypothetical protein